MVKIALIGVGSVCFGASTIGDVLYYKKQLWGSTLALVDTDPEKLELMTLLAEKMNREAGSPFTILSNLDRKKVLAGSDFVVTSPAIEREDLWEKDWRIINGLGIKQTYGENGGPGSLSHTLRNIPMMKAICEDVQALAPNAVLINFTNPEARLCTYFARHTNLRFVGLCHQIYEGYRAVSRVLEVPQEELDIKAAGINHFTWMYDIRSKVTGEDLYPLFAAKLKEMPQAFEPMSRKLFDLYGMYPTAGDHHLAEFCSFGWEFQGLHGRDFPQTRKDKADAMQWLRGVKAGTRQISDVVKEKSPESVADVIVAMTTGDNRYEVSVDIVNNGCIPNLPADAVVEVPGVVSGDQVRGLSMKPLPEGIAAMIRTQITIARLSVEAALTGDRGKAMQALLLDPVVDTIAVAEKALDQLLEAHSRHVAPEFLSN